MAQCGICHSLSGSSFTAPHLKGLFGRVAGDLDWPYSEIFAQADFVWTEEILNSYLEFPRAMMPGNNMAFYGIENASDRRDLIAFIKKMSVQQ
jgi:cytochrome c